MHREIHVSGWKEKLMCFASDMNQYGGRLRQRREAGTAGLFVKLNVGW